MTINIDNLTEQELNELHYKIVQRLRFLESMHHHQEMLRFNIGDKVSFNPPGRGCVMGTLVKYNKKSVTIITDDGQKWNVAPQLIAKIKPVNTYENNSNVVAIHNKNP